MSDEGRRVQFRNENNRVLRNKIYSLSFSKGVPCYISDGFTDPKRVGGVVFKIFRRIEFYKC